MSVRASAAGGAEKWLGETALKREEDGGGREAKAPIKNTLERTECELPVRMIRRKKKSERHLKKKNAEGKKKISVWTFQIASLISHVTMERNVISQV